MGTEPSLYLYFWGLQNHCRWCFSHEINRCLLLGRKALTNLDSILKSRDITLPTKVCLVKAMVFPVVMYGMWELDYKESWALKNWCFWTVMQKKTWIFIGSPDAEAEVTGLPDAKSRLIGKDCNAGKDWGQEEKGVTENKMIRWHHQLNGHEFEQALGVMKDREAWRAAVHGVTKRWTRLGN